MNHPFAQRRRPRLLAVCRRLRRDGRPARPRRPDAGRPRRRSRLGAPVGREPRRLLHQRRGRPLGREHERKLIEDRRARVERLLRQRRGTGETIEGCHRSKSAEVYIGAGVSGKNFACSGAKTSTFTSEGLFKPGLDFYNSGGHEGQALMLQHFAATHNVKLVAISIGGNNFNFAGIVQDCLEDWLLTPEWWPDLLQRRKLRDEKLHREQRRHAEVGDRERRSTTSPRR